MDIKTIITKLASIDSSLVNAQPVNEDYESDLQAQQEKNSELTDQSAEEPVFTKSNDHFIETLNKYMWKNHFRLAETCPILHSRNRYWREAYQEWGDDFKNIFKSTGMLCYYRKPDFYFAFWAGGGAPNPDNTIMQYTYDLGYKVTSLERNVPNHGDGEFNFTLAQLNKMSEEQLFELFDNSWKMVPHSKKPEFEKYPHAYSLKEDECCEICNESPCECQEADATCEKCMECPCMCESANHCSDCESSPCKCDDDAYNWDRWPGPSAGSLDDEYCEKCKSEPCVCGDHKKPKMIKETKSKAADVENFRDGLDGFLENYAAEYEIPSPEVHKLLDQMTDVFMNWASEDFEDLPEYDQMNEGWFDKFKQHEEHALSDELRSKLRELMQRIHLMNLDIDEIMRKSPKDVIAELEQTQTKLAQVSNSLNQFVTNAYGEPLDEAIDGLISEHTQFSVNDKPGWYLAYHDGNYNVTGVHEGPYKTKDQARNEWAEYDRESKRKLMVTYWDGTPSDETTNLNESELGLANASLPQDNLTCSTYNNINTGEKSIDIHASGTEAEKIAKLLQICQSADDSCEDDVCEEKLFANEPDEHVYDADEVTKNLAGGLNRPKKQVNPAKGNDNGLTIDALAKQLKENYQKFLKK